MKFQTLLAACVLPLASVLAAPSPPPQISDRAPEADAEASPPKGFTQSRPPPVPVSDGKYFHEPGTNNELGHYDIRYFKRLVTYEERQDTLSTLIRSYLTIFREHNIETWIAHGTLLGWWWNGQIMPWDWDLDTQVSASTLTWLGENMNMTFHNYTSVTMDGKETTREFLLDINPYHKERVRGNGLNVIDARWVDTRNGLFIDITGLSEVYPDTQPGVWSCKNWHRYRTRDLYPLRESIFEGVPALVPYSFDKILTEEYSARALTKTLHEGHRWSPEQKEWIKQSPTTPFQIVPRSVPHVPRSLLDEDTPKPGLKNLFKAF